MYFLCRNASRAIGMCPQEMWEKIDKGGSWVRSMSPFDRKLLDIRMAGVFSKTLELSIEEGDGASTNRLKELACNFHVGLGTFLFRYLPGLLHSILMEMGISKDMHYPLTIDYIFRATEKAIEQHVLVGFIILLTVLNKLVETVQLHACAGRQVCQNTLQEMIILAPLLTAKNNLVPMLFSLKLLLEEESLTTLMLVPQIPHLMIHQLVLQHEYSSSKIKAVLEVQSHCKVESPISGFNGSKGSSATSMAYSNSSIEGPIKAIVFSQWTSMLDLVEISLNQYCIQYRRLDGTLTLSSRDRTVKDLNTDPKVTVMLMSLKAGNLGLNMVAACHEILLDLWWNPTTEDQDVDRAHRIAQTRPVTVT